MSFHVSSDIDLIYASKSTPFIANTHPSVMHVQARQRLLNLVEVQETKL